MKCSFLKALWSQLHTYIDESHQGLLACFKDTEHKHSESWLQFSEQVVASGREKCSHFLKISNRFCETFSFDCTPSKRCCLISAYSQELYYSVLLDYFLREQRQLLHTVKCRWLPPISFNALCSPKTCIKCPVYIWVLLYLKWLQSTYLLRNDQCSFI